MASTATIMAGIPAKNAALFHAMRFSVGDPVALIRIDGNSTLILRDIEMERASKHARVEKVHCPADFEPKQGLSGDRETATAQAAAEFLSQNSVKVVTGDRSLPLIFSEMLRERGIEVKCDHDLGVSQRRSKSAEEVKWLQDIQTITEAAVRLACERIANADANADGILMHDGSPLTSERVRAEVDIFLMNQNCAPAPAIIAAGPQGADCHNLGDGPIKTGVPVIVDIFPENRATGYNGDCSRTVVHGQVPDEVQKMHAAVVAAKQAGIDLTKTGVTGEDVHKAVIATITEHGFKIGIPAESEPAEYCGMVHGTGHGVGLDVHESPLLDFKGPALVAGDVITIEPGLYSKAIGGIRIEDMVVVTDEGCRNLNKLPEELTWK